LEHEGERGIYRVRRKGRVWDWDGEEEGHVSNLEVWCVRVKKSQEEV